MLTVWRKNKTKSVFKSKQRGLGALSTSSLDYLAIYLQCVYYSFGKKDIGYRFAHTNQAFLNKPCKNNCIRYPVHI